MSRLVRLYEQPPHSLFVSMRIEDGVLSVRPTGPVLGQREAPIVAADVNAALASLGDQLRMLVIDLSDVQLMPSFGLGMCIELRNRLHQRGVPTVLYGLSSELAALIRLVKVDRLYIMARDRKELARATAA